MVQIELPLCRKRTAKELILEYLALQTEPIAIHHFDIASVSQNSIGSRLPELAIAKKVYGGFYNGEPYKRWNLINKEVV